MAFLSQSVKFLFFIPSKTSTKQDFKSVQDWRKKMGHLPFLADLENRSNLQLTGSMKKSSILNKVWSIISDNTNCITHFIHTNIFLDSDMLKLFFGQAILSFLFQAKSLSCGFRCLSIFSYGNLHFTKRHCCLRSVS